MRTIYVVYRNEFNKNVYRKFNILNKKRKFPVQIHPDVLPFIHLHNIETVPHSNFEKRMEGWHQCYYLTTRPVSKEAYLHFNKNYGSNGMNSFHLKKEAEFD